MLVKNVPNIIVACCTLHNIPEKHGDTFNEEWIEGLENEDVISTNGNEPITSTRNSQGADEIRPALIDYFMQHPLRSLISTVVNFLAEVMWLNMINKTCLQRGCTRLDENVI